MDSVGGAIFWLIISLGLLAGSIIQAFQGDFGPAIFLAILWHGFNNNAKD